MVGRSGSRGYGRGGYRQGRGFEGKALLESKETKPRGGQTGEIITPGNLTTSGGGAGRSLGKVGAEGVKLLFHFRYLTGAVLGQSA